MKIAAAAVSVDDAGIADELVEAILFRIGGFIVPGAEAIEAERLRVLRSFDILDTDPEQAFDDVMLLAGCNPGGAELS